MLTNPLELTAADVAAGAEAFGARCAQCHGADGTGPLLWQNGRPRPSDLTDPRMREHVDGEVYWVVTNGIKESGMPASASALSERARWQVVAYVRTLAGIKLALSTPGAGGSYVWGLPPGFPRPKVPADNPMSAAKVELGRHLFYDTRLSSDNSFSCSSCHQQDHAFADDKGRGVGVTGEVHPRGSMSLTNIAYSPVLTWANPTQRKLETQALVPMFGEDPVELGLSGKEKEMLARLAAVPTYRELFAAAFPGAPDPITLANVTKGIASFERVLISGRSPYDRYRTGEDPIAISDSAKRGEALFFSETVGARLRHGDGAGVHLRRDPSPLWRQVYRQEVNETLLLRALTFFDDAEREAGLPGEGPDDWTTVKEFFWNRVGQLLIPPARELQIERRVVDVVEG